VKWNFSIAAFFAVLAMSFPAFAGFGIYSVGGKVGLDVVQSNDTRQLFTLQADVASVFTPRLHLELAGESGNGADLDGTNIQVRGGNLILKYIWPNARRTAFAYLGFGFGVTRIRRFLISSLVNTYQSTLHLVLLGMEKHTMQGRLKGFVEMRFIFSDIEDASSIRVAFGLGFNVKKP